MINVVCGIIKKSNKVLIGRRGSGESMPGFWEFPGGKIEKGETNKASLKRELMEELEIDAEVGSLISKYRYDYPDKSINLFFYNISNYSGKINIKVHDKIIWEKLENLKNYKFLPGDIPLINEIQRK